MSIKSEAKIKLARYCAYQERSQKEVRTRLSDLGIYGDLAEEIISELISDNYINEERFARTFIGGKFRVKKWGRNKILQAIKPYDISDYCIKKGLDEIDEQEYQNTLESVLRRKDQSLTEENLYQRRNKIAKYAISRGFEPDLVWDWLKQHI